MAFYYPNLKFKKMYRLLANPLHQTSPRSSPPTSPTSLATHSPFYSTTAYATTSSPLSLALPQALSAASSPTSPPSPSSPSTPPHPPAKMLRIVVRNGDCIVAADDGSQFLVLSDTLSASSVWHDLLTTAVPLTSGGIPGVRVGHVSGDLLYILLAKAHGQLRIRDAHWTAAWALELAEWCPVDDPHWNWPAVFDKIEPEQCSTRELTHLVSLAARPAFGRAFGAFAYELLWERGHELRANWSDAAQDADLWPHYTGIEHGFMCMLCAAAGMLEGVARDLNDLVVLRCGCCVDLASETHFGASFNPWHLGEAFRGFWRNYQREVTPNLRESCRASHPEAIREAIAAREDRAERTLRRVAWKFGKPCAACCAGACPAHPDVGSEVVVLGRGIPL